MKFAAFLPPCVVEDASKRVPVLYWLSGLTCTHENFITKAGAQRIAAEEGIMLVCPDTSPRGIDIAGQDDSYDFGSGAGFYVDATKAPWSEHYRMYSYVRDELRADVLNELPVASGKESITGHSMGGHGAIMFGLRNPDIFKSISAFAPICSPSTCAWGTKALGGYLGDDKSAWAQYDSTLLAKQYTGPARTILIDQGAADNFLEQNQLQPEALEAAAKDVKSLDVQVRRRDGYDHSYYFIASFIDDHIRFHAKEMRK